LPLDLQSRAAGNSVPAIQPLLSDQDVAVILGTTLDWVRSHTGQIPGFERLGIYRRFHREPIEQWLGGLDHLLKPEEVALLLNVPRSWVYANADQISGCIRLGRYVRFRPSAVKQFLGGSEACQ
jgi:predicted DNA-binding transcriptional regulator AlpA